MRESELELKFCNEVARAGGITFKFVSPGNTGVPDRIVIMPENKIGFVELKAPGRKSRPEQCFQQRKLESKSCYVAVLDNPEMINVIIREITEHEVEE